MERRKRLSSQPFFYFPSPLAEAAHLFFRFDETLMLKGHDPSLYSFPNLDKKKIQSFITLIESDGSFDSICKFLSAHFSFDPAYLNGCSCNQFEPNECHLGIIANTLGWIASKDYFTPDYFESVMEVLINKLIRDGEQLILSLIQTIVKYYTMFYSKLLPVDLVNKLCEFGGNHLEYADKITDIMINLLDPFDEITYTPIIMCINNLVRLMPKKFNEFDFSLLYLKCRNKFAVFDFDSLTMLTSITDFQVTESILIVYQDLAKSAINAIEKTSKKSYSLGVKANIDYESPHDSISQTLSPKSFYCLPKHVDPFKAADLESSIALVDILSDECFKIHSIFQPLLHRKSSECPKSFLFTFANLLIDKYNDPCFIELYAFFVSLLQNLDDLDLPKDMFQILYNSPVFSSDYLVAFSSKEDSNLINCLRNLTFSVIVANWPKQLSRLIQQSSPFLFAESIGRINTVISFENINNFLDSKLISELSEATQYFIFMLNQNHSEAAMKSWATLIIFMFNIMDSPDGCMKAFIVNKFTEIFLFHAFHEPYRQNVFNYLKRYLLQVPSQSSLSIIAHFALSIFRETVTADDEFQTVAIDFLACIESAISHTNEIVQPFTIMVPAMISFFLEHPSQNLLSLILSMIVKMNLTNFSLTIEESYQLAQSIYLMEPEGLSEQTFSKLISLLTTNKSVSMNTTKFVITNSCFIQLIFLISSNDIKNHVKFFDELCDYSTYNRIQCHNGQLDILLIELVQNYPNSFEFNQCTFKNTFTTQEIEELVIPLITKILYVRSSPVSIEKFIGLAVPNEKGVFPQFSDIIADQLNLPPLGPRIRYVYTPKCVPREFDPIPIESIDAGFTFSCYLNVDQALAPFTTGQPVLLKLADDKGSYFMIFVSGAYIFCEFNLQNTTSSAPLTTVIPSCEWFMITCVLKEKEKDPTKYELTFALNKEQTVLLHVGKPDFVGTNLKVSVGGFKEQFESDFIFCYLGTFKLFDSPFSRSMVISLLSDNDTMKSVLNPPDMEQNENGFISPLRNVIKWNSIVPFFDFINEAPPHFIEKLVNLLEFIPSEYFPLLSYYLLKCKAEKLTYALYLRFYDLFTLTTDNNLFLYIIFNHEIWSNAPMVHLKRIVTHWSQVLFPTFPNYFVRVITFDQILISMRIFYYYSNIESDIIEPHSDEMDTRICSRHFAKILYQYSASSLKHNDVQCLISHIVICRDTMQKVVFLQILIDISENIDNKIEVATQLHSIFIDSKPEIFSRTLLAINGLTKEEFPNHLQMLICNLGKCRIYDGLFDQIMEIVDVNPVYINLLAILAINIKGDTLTKASSKLADITSRGFDVCREIARLRFWFVWLINLTLLHPEEQQDKIITSVAQIVMSNLQILVFDELFVYLDCLSIINNVNTYQFKYKILSYLCNNVQIPDETLSTFLVYRCGRFICFSFDNQIHSDSLRRAFSESPYPLEYMISKKPVININDFRSVMEIISTPITNQLMFRFNVDPKIKDLYDGLISKIVGFVKFVDINDKPVINYYLLFDYFNQKSKLTACQNFQMMHDITSMIEANSENCRYTYTTGMSKVLTKMRQQISNDIEAADILLSIANPEAVQNCLTSIGSDKSLRQMIRINNYNIINKFKEQNTHEFSIWRKFNTREEYFEKSFRLDYFFTSPILKSKHQVIEADSRPKTIQAKPILKAQIKLIKFQRTKDIKFVILATQILLIDRMRIRTLEMNDLRLILKRNIKKEVTYYEFVLKYGKTYLLDFLQNDIYDILYKIEKYASNVIVQKSDYSSFVQSMEITQQWMSHRMNNFHYLTCLNFYGGRTYKSMNLYPMMPNVIGETKEFIANPMAWLQRYPIFKRLFLKLDRDMETLNVPLETLMDNGGLLWTPEFYQTPECFEEYPSHFNGPVDFVYSMRKLLETDEFTELLPSWIDNVFGYVRNKNLNTHTLFKKAHPIRPPLSDPAVTEVVNFMINIGFIQYASIGVISNDTFIIRALSNTNEYSEIIVNLKDQIVREHWTEIVDFRNTIFASYKQGMVLIDNNEANIKIINNNKVRDVKKQFPHIEFICEDIETIFCSSYEGIAFGLDPKDASIYGIARVAPEIPLCVASSKQAGITAVGIKSGNICVFEAMTGKFIRSLDLEGMIPKKIIVTHSWGFIIVQTSGFLFLFDINGTRLIKKEIESEVLHWTTCCSTKGFDYLICVEATGKVVVYEAFNLLLKKNVFTCPNKVASIKYSFLIHGLIVLIVDGKGVFIPFDIDL